MTGQEPAESFIARLVIFLFRRIETAKGAFALLLLAAAVVLGVGGLAAKQSQTRAAGEARRASAAAGERTFASRCAGCHGLDGRGGERAPNIVQERAVQRLTDAELERIIRQGVFGTGMPAFRSLGDSEIRSVVAYLRTLQGATKTADLPGDPESGKKLFFGKPGCSACHMMAGVGGFIGSDLSGFARTHSADEIRDAIVNPNPNRDRQGQTAMATTLEGEKLIGRVRNEDNFSVQLQTLDGTFHFLSRSDLKSLEYSPQSIMPSDYKSRLSPGDLNDITSYLMEAAGPNRPAKDIENEGEQE
jgi:cytochrome c oxidase cbb3-type subunit III